MDIDSEPRNWRRVDHWQPPPIARGRRETARAHLDVSSWDSHKTNGDKVEAQHFKQCLQRHRPTDGRGSPGES